MKAASGTTPKATVAITVRQHDFKPQKRNGPPGKQEALLPHSPSGSWAADRADRI